MRPSARSPPTRCYTVGNYPVDARADNAVAAKDKALADGQQAAFRSLLKRLVPVTDYDRMKRLAGAQVGRPSSRASPCAPSATPRPLHRQPRLLLPSDSVRAVLQQEGIPFVEEQARESSSSRSWRTGRARHATRRAWTDVWKGLDLEHTLTPVKLQVLKKEITPAAIDALAGGDGAAIRTFVASYVAENI